MEITIDFLDRALLYIKQNSSFSKTKVDVPEFSKDENKLLPRAFYKLEKDGYVYKEVNVTDNDKHQTVRFYISFDGLLALENSPFHWKNRPYRWNKIKGIINTTWKIVKIMIIVLNAIAILYLMYLSVPK